MGQATENENNQILHMLKSCVTVVKKGFFLNLFNSLTTNTN